jgi:hypothetical protein
MRPVFCYNYAVLKVREFFSTRFCHLSTQKLLLSTQFEIISTHFSVLSTHFHHLSTNFNKTARFPQPYLHFKAYYFSYSTHFSTLSTVNTVFIHIINRIHDNYPQVVNYSFSFTFFIHRKIVKQIGIFLD